MQAIRGFRAHRLTPGVALACLLVGGMAGSWFGIRSGHGPADAFAEQNGKEPTSAARGTRAPLVVAVVTRDPGRSPQSMESEITDRLERAVRHAEGLRAIESKTTTGQSIVQLHFDETVTPPIALAQAAGLAGIVVPHFPPGTQPLDVMVLDQARTLPACILVMDHAGLTAQQQADMARHFLLGELASLAGITAQLGPAPERVLAVLIDRERLKAHQLSVQEVHDALQGAATPPPTDLARLENRRFLLASPLLSLGDLEKLPVRKGAPSIYLRDVARIADSSDAPTALTHVNGRHHVWVAIHGRRGTSDAAAREAIKMALAKMKGRLPQEAKLDLLTFGHEGNPDAGVVTLHVRAAAGTRLEACDDLITQVEQYLKTIIPPTDVRFMLAHVGPDTSASAAWPLRAGPHQATLRLQLTQPAGARELVTKLRPLLRQRFPDLRVSFHAGAGTSWPVSVRVGGGTPGQCEKVAGQVAERLAHLREAADVEADERLPSLHIDVDREKAAELGVSQADVQREYLAFATGITSRLQVAQAGLDPSVKVRVILRLPEAEIQSLQDLSNLPIVSPRLRMAIPLGNLATFKRSDAPAEIEHQDLTRVVTVRVNTDEMDRGPLVRAVENSLKTLPLPEGMWLKVHTTP